MYFACLLPDKIHFMGGVVTEYALFVKDRETFLTSTVIIPCKKDAFLCSTRMLTINDCDDPNVSAQLCVPTLLPVPLPLQPSHFLFLWLDRLDFEIFWVDIKFDIFRLDIFSHQHDMIYYLLDLSFSKAI